MLKIVAVYGLLFASLLGCPYLCLAHCLVPSGRVVQGCQCSACTQGEQPVDPAPDADECGGCLCRGALLEAPARDLQPHARPVAIIPSTDDAASRSLAGIGRGRVAHAAQFAALCSGREIRALIASRLL